MTKKEIELQCDIAWQEKYLELTGHKIGDEVVCSFTAHHGNAKQSYSYSVEGKGVIVMTEKGIFVRSNEEYPVAHSEKRRPFDRNSYWVYNREIVYSSVRYIRP